MDRIAISKPVVFVCLLLPMGWIVWAATHGLLGADPIKALTHESGVWGLRILLLTLSLTPLRVITGWSGVIRYRRMTGLFGFFYITAHLAVYIVLDLGGYWPDLLTDIIKRPYITVGFLAWLLLIPLAATSTRGMMRRLGRRWKKLHRLVYVIVGLGLLHFMWGLKADRLEAIVYILIFASLMLLRLQPVQSWLRQQRSESQAA